MEIEAQLVQIGDYVDLGDVAFTVDQIHQSRGGDVTLFMNDRKLWSGRLDDKVEVHERE